MQWPRRPACSLGLLVLCAAPAGAESLDVLRRQTPLEIDTGVAAVRVVNRPRLDVPVDCGRGPLACTEEQVFSSAYEIELAAERRDLTRDATGVERDARGTIRIAVHLESEDEETWDARMRAALTALGAFAFVDDFAGLAPSDPLFKELAALSSPPSWTCFQRDRTGQVTKYSRTYGKLPDGITGVIGSGTSGYRWSAESRVLCDDIAAAVRSARPEELRTLPIPRRVREDVVRVGIADWLPERDVADEVLELPGEAWFVRRPDPGALAGRSSGTDGVYHRASFSRGEIRWEARVGRADIPPDSVAGPAWLSRWTLESIERRFGAEPTERLLHRDVLAMALLPTRPPVEVDEDDEPVRPPPAGPHAVKLISRGYLAEVAQRLDRQGSVDAKTLERALVRDPAGLVSEGWIQVVCRADGTAEYTLQPAGAHAPVENAALFCAALESRVPF